MSLPVLHIPGMDRRLGHRSPHRSARRRAGCVSRGAQRHGDGADRRGDDDEGRTGDREAPGHALEPITWSYPPGQPIYLLRNVGGGDWKIWVNGVSDQQYIPSQGYCTADKQSSDECALTVVQQPESRLVGQGS